MTSRWNAGPQLSLLEDTNLESQSNNVLSNIKFSSQTNEWFTPAVIAASASLVMGGIELDPASCDEANKTICAERIYTESDNGLTKSWLCRSLWLNPPYGKYRGVSNQGRWTHRLVYEYQEKRVQQAVCLVNAYFGYEWFKLLIALSSIAYGLCNESVLAEIKQPDARPHIPMPPICFTFDRLSFLPPEAMAEQGSKGKDGRAKYGSAIFYYGPNKEAFRDEFCQYGFIVGCD